MRERSPGGSSIQSLVGESVEKKFDLWWRQEPSASLGLLMPQATNHLDLDRMNAPSHCIDINVSAIWCIEIEKGVTAKHRLHNGSAVDALPPAISPALRARLSLLATKTTASRSERPGLAVQKHV